MSGHAIISHGLQSGPDATKATALARRAESLGWSFEILDYRDLDAVSQLGDVLGRILRLREAALAAGLDNVKTDTDPVFGLAIPREVKAVPSEVLNPRTTWRDAAAYDAQAKKLAGMFRENFEKFGSVDPAIKNAGPKG